MFFFAFWGKKHVETRLGFAADFCCYCRKIRAFEIDRIGIARHVYYVSISEGELIGHTQRCVSCQAVSSSNPNRFYSIADSTFDSVDLLARETFPSLNQEFQERFDIEDRIKRDPNGLDPELRKQLLLEPFHLTTPFFDGYNKVEGLRLLTIALRPLKPTEDEVRDCLNHFRRIRAKIGAKLRTENVMNELYPVTNPGDYSY